ncbi:Protein of unknown function [Cotesia congregata]|uniref:Uncharacterized protein n=1 Tax=Cotesia congregata TaxID=51543 RepID=A0A8J2HCI8_COTCN|nr:Protein of unknown function [Cotesia congregata]
MENFFDLDDMLIPVVADVDSDAETEVDDDLPGPVGDIESDDSGYDNDVEARFDGPATFRNWFGLHSRIAEANPNRRIGRIYSLYVDEELCVERFRHAATLPAGRHLLDLEFVPQIRQEGFLFMDPLLVLLGDLDSREAVWIFNYLPWQHREFRGRSLLRGLIGLGSRLRASIRTAPPRIVAVLEWFMMALEIDDE